MTGRERFLTAINNQKADRMACQDYSVGKAAGRRKGNLLRQY